MAAERAQALVAELARKCGWLADGAARRRFAAHAPQVYSPGRGAGQTGRPRGRKLHARQLAMAASGGAWASGRTAAGRPCAFSTLCLPARLLCRKRGRWDTRDEHTTL